ncbi:relaxase/mobilization nuclease domain-containing protein [Rhizosphaericola mali]|uniref:Relaxase/mobilization nuclease domain-containing protein n=1 Tax=Rhizosphaericola mali TaxID=2545455 RepID=A0A5P2G6J1_9BACT|nr:relaxase/mobilization nuclease domain-containing protein [Rhizosphaericola mali]QES90328.1 relaxase/mobilization nuclease domain-containing protein [Rhizosphaericola mali]
MIAKQTTAKASSVSHMVSYVLRENGLKHSEEKAQIIFQNALVGEHTDQIVAQMQMALDLNNQRCSLPLFHAIFSLSEGESLNEAQELQLAAMIMQEFKLDKNMFLLCKHSSPVSKEHYHAVIVRPPIDGRQVVNLFQSKQRLMNIARKCEMLFHLKQVKTPKTWKQKLNSSNNEKQHWNTRQLQARMDLKNALYKATSMLEFITHMQNLGYSLHKARGLGIVHQSSGIYFKASSLGCSLSKIEKIIAFNKKQQKAPMSSSQVAQLERNIALAKRGVDDGTLKSTLLHRDRFMPRQVYPTSKNNNNTSATIETVTKALIDYMISPLKVDIDGVYFGAMGMDESEEKKRIKEKIRIKLSM